MGTSHARKFWQDASDEQQRLAQTYDEHIELTHPSAVTSDGVGHRLIHHDVWCATKVVYPEYRGPSIESL